MHPRCLADWRVRTQVATEMMVWSCCSLLVKLYGPERFVMRTIFGLELQPCCSSLLIMAFITSTPIGLLVMDE